MKIKIANTDLPNTLRLPTPIAPVQRKLDIPQAEELNDFEQLALTHALNLSALVYDDAAHVLAQMHLAGFTESHFFSRFPGAQAACGISNGVAYIAFRGTSSGLDWVMNLLMFPAYWPLRHWGFETVWRRLRKDIEDWLQTTHPANIVLTGHSLGGAMAHLAAMQLASSHAIKNVFTFGAPKACYLGTAERYDKIRILPERSVALGEITWCVINQRDIVANVPFALLGYCDVGHLIYIDGNNDVSIGDTAVKRRIHDSMRDSAFIFNFLDTESIAIAGQQPKPAGEHSGIRKTLTLFCEVVPLAKTPVTLLALYILVVSYLMRSGFAHMCNNYESVLLPGMVKRPARQTPSRLKTVNALFWRIVVSLLLLVLFVWGLKILVMWLWAGFSPATVTE